MNVSSMYNIQVNIVDLRTNDVYKFTNEWHKNKINLCVPNTFEKKNSVEIWLPVVNRLFEDDPNSNNPLQETLGPKIFNTVHTIMVYVPHKK